MKKKCFKSQATQLPKAKFEEIYKRYLILVVLIISNRVLVVELIKELSKVAR
jgi:hypothetical protein